MAGFIGSHLADRLLNDGHDVVGIDSFDDYYDRKLKERNLDSALRQPRFRLVEGDLLDLELGPLLAGTSCVYHLAAQPGVRGSWGRQFDRYLRNNVLATQRLLEAARAARPARLVYGGSSSAYGDQPEGPCPETAAPNPLSPYGITKLAGERLAHSYAGAYGIDAVVLRFFTVYGPRQRPDMAFHRFIERQRRGDPLPVFGDGGQRRDFTYIDDIIGGIVAAARRGATGQLYNLGRGEPVALREVFRILEEISGKPVRTQTAAQEPGDPKTTWADLSRSRRDLGFAPAVSLDEGLGRQWRWQTG